MHARTISFTVALLLCAGAAGRGGWRRVLESAGLESARLVLLEGDSQEARAAGFTPTADRVEVRSVADTMLPSLRIYWEKPVAVPRFQVPSALNNRS